MKTTRYRSYVIRVWGADEGSEAVARVVVEEVRSGLQVELRGEPAVELNLAISAALARRGEAAGPSGQGREVAGQGETRMILVVGATGMVGSEICRRLAATGWPVRALVRETSSADKVAALRALGVETVVGALQDRASLDAACRGVSAVITTVSSMPFSYRPGENDIRTTDTDGAMHLVDAAVAAGVGHFTYTSFSINLAIPTPLLEAKRSVERYLMASGLHYTVLRPSCFMEVWLSPAVGFDAADARATIYGAGTEPISWIAAADVAEFAVRSIDVPAARDAVLELGGPDALSPLDAVRIFEQAGGREFALQHVPVEALEAQQEAATDPMAKTLAGLMRCVALGDQIDMEATLRAIPIPMTTVSDYANAFVHGMPVPIG
jgi:NADH dehydrogenase